MSKAKSNLDLPLKGVTVLEFCQYLSGPSAGLRLADFGARVIKIESPKGDACRKLAIENLWVDEHDSLLFHTINRNKESIAVNLKDESDLTLVKKLIIKSDVVIHNFRPGVMEKLGLGHDDCRKLNARIIYAEITGYGSDGPWSKKPGQDLLLQAKSGLMFTSGNGEDPPVPFGIAIGDILCGAHLVQGIIGALIRREQQNIGSKLEVSLLESLLDFQFELLTTYYSSGQLPQRSKTNNGHALLGAPYGLHQTQNGWIAIAMVPINKLAIVLECKELEVFVAGDGFSRRDHIKSVLAAHLASQTTEYWLEKLRKEDLWAMPLTDWRSLKASKGYQSLEMENELENIGLNTTRCPIRINHQKLKSTVAAPSLGMHTDSIINEFGLR